MYDPQSNSEDVELAGLWSTLKKGAKAVGKGIGKVTDYTITKPSAAIGGLVGGKKGRAWGKKIGGFTAKVTNVGVGAGLGGAIAGAAPLSIATTLGGALAAKKAFGSKVKISARVGGSASASGSSKTPGFVSPKFTTQISRGIKESKPAKRSSCKSQNQLAAEVAAKLAKTLGGPLSSANKSLKLAALQRTATYEHNKIMTDSDFRKKVLKAISAGAVAGQPDCQKTIRVLMGR